MTTNNSVFCLETDRLRLEFIQEGHADEIFPALQCPDLYTFLEEEPPRSPSALRERYTMLREKKSPDGSEIWLNWVARDKSTDKCIGTFQATVEVEEDLARLAYIVFPEFQGRGFAKDGTLAVMSFVLATYPIERCIIEADTRNLASVCVALGLGFRLLVMTNRVTVFKGYESHEYCFQYVRPRKTFRSQDLGIAVTV